MKYLKIAWKSKLERPCSKCSVIRFLSKTPTLFEFLCLFFSLLFRLFFKNKIKFSLVFKFFNLSRENLLLLNIYRLWIVIFPFSGGFVTISRSKNIIFQQKTKFSAKTSPFMLEIFRHNKNYNVRF